jgi:glyoxylase-like metal-dependent hydrolase (beta-lactamase superfamily II)
MNHHLDAPAASSSARLAFADATYACVTSIVDAEGAFARFRDAFPAADEAAARRAWPELFRGDDWLLPFRAYLLRRPDATVLIDTGVGPTSDLLKRPQSLLPGALSREAIDLVVLTHLHTDHIGWAAVDKRPFFPNARYVVSGADYGLFGSRLRILAQRDVLTLVHGATEVVRGVRLWPTPGHTPGHMSVVVDDVIVVLGDVAVHPAQIADASLAYALEYNPRQAAATRHALFERLAANPSHVLAAGHLPQPFGRIRRAGRGFSYEPLRERPERTAGRGETGPKPRRARALDKDCPG